jgi:hypothetical protein
LYEIWHLSHVHIQEAGFPGGGVVGGMHLRVNMLGGGFVRIVVVAIIIVRNLKHEDKLVSRTYMYMKLW